jgi:uncharacterized membrane protein YcjF (UPF0283 family)
MNLPEFGFSLLSAMITPAVLISACGTLIFSTSTRLARVVDRARDLSEQIQRLFTEPGKLFDEERRREVEQQLGFYARRARMVQSSLTSLYVALGFFVACTISIAITPFVSGADWVPTVLGIVGTVVLFIGCMMLVTETRLGIQCLASEMEFSLRLAKLYQEHDDAPGRTEALASLDQMAEKVEQGFPHQRRARH